MKPWQKNVSNKNGMYSDVTTVIAVINAKLLSNFLYTSSDAKFMVVFPFHCGEKIGINSIPAN